MLEETKIRPYLHLGFWAFSLGLLALFAGLGAYQSRYLATPMLAIASAAIILTAIWSVFGPGEYWKRFAVSHCFGLGLMLLMLYGLIRRPPYYPFDGIVVGKSALLAAFTLSVASQLPLWFFRSILGWRFLHPSHQTPRPFSLRDILFSSLIVGFAIVSAQQSGRVTAEYNSRNAWPTGAVHGEKTTMPVLGNDGVYRTTEVVADPIEIERTRAIYVQQQAQASLVAIGITSTIFGTIALLSVPFLRCAMLPRNLGFPYASGDGDPWPCCICHSWIFRSPKVTLCLSRHRFLHSVLVQYYDGRDRGGGVRNSAQRICVYVCLLYTSPSPRDQRGSRMPSSA